MNTLLVALVLVSSQDTSARDDRLIGLLTLPQVFGEGACVPFEPRPIPLFARPRAREPIAQLQVDKNWTFHQDGGCADLDVRVHESGRPPAALPTKEYGYEMPAAVVVARDGEWFQIRTEGRSMWLHRTAENSYLPLVELLSSNSPAYLTGDWDGALHGTPGGARLRVPKVAPDQPVHLRGSRRVSGDLWLLVETTENNCTGPDGPKIPKVRAWVRAYGGNGSPAVWFSSRGC